LAQTELLVRLNAASASDEVEDKDDDGEDEKQVDKRAADVKAEAQQPKDEENYDDGPKHGVDLLKT
jgi:hypothetical protein